MDIDWLAMLWDKEANGLLLIGREMRQISGISEQNAVNTALLELMHRRPNQISNCGLAGKGVENSTPHG